jgi:drug/metabolite transporter (DMT)-like permease
MGLHYLVLLLIQFLFGANFVFSKIVVGHLDPIAFAGVRFVISGLFLFLVQVLRGNSLAIPRESYLLTLGLGIVGVAMAQALFMLGLEKTTAVNTSLISSTIPIFVFLINKMRRIGEWDRWKVIGLSISFSGVLVLRKIENFSFAEAGFQGDLMVLGACFCLAMMLSFSGDLFRKVPAITGSAHIFLIGGVTLLPFVFFRDIGNITSFEESRFLGSFLFAVFGATCLAYLLNNWVLSKVESGIVGLFIFLQPVLTAFLSFIILSEPMTQRTLFSFLMILIGVIAVVRPISLKRIN